MDTDSDFAMLTSSRPYLAGVDDEPVARAIINSEHPHQYLYDKLLSDPVERIDEGAVVRRMADGLAITRHREAPQTPPGLAGFMSDRPLIPIGLDGPVHTMWRKVLDPVFSPRKMAALEDHVRVRAREFVDELAPRGSADVYDDFCEPLPPTVFLDLMGIDHAALPGFLEFKKCVLPSSKFIPTAEEVTKAYEDCQNWFLEEFDRRRASGDLGEDIVGGLLRVEVEDRPINTDELLGICTLLMIAGLDTVGGTLACDLAWLARHPAERKKLVADPELWPTAIEELLRWESPVQGQSGYATTDIELPSGELIPAGTNAMVYISAQNLDPDVFEDPLTVKLDRNPNPHVAFASGFHRCLGSHLARMELRVFLEEFHRQIPDYEIPEGVTLTYWGAVRAPRPLPLVWG
jgi:cytochrome P450